MKAFYNKLSKPAQNDIACFLLFTTMMCSVFCVVGLLCVGVSLQEGLSVNVAFGIPIAFGLVAMVSQVVSKVLDI